VQNLKVLINSRLLMDQVCPPQSSPPSMPYPFIAVHYAHRNVSIQPFHAVVVVVGEGGGAK